MDHPTPIGNPLEDARLASAVFFPRPDQPFGPTSLGVRDHMVEVPEARIRIREFPGAKGAPVILFFRLPILARLMPLSALLTGCAVFSPAFQSAAAPPTGPLRIHPENPRYFTDGAKMPDGSLRAVYLTGAHTWNNLVDMGRNDPPETFDWEAYLNFLERHHHNFIEWIDPSRPEPAARERLNTEDGARHFQAPFDGGAMLYLKARKAR